MKCQCTGPGWCERHQVAKSAHLVDLCRREGNYWVAWEEGRGPGQIKKPETPRVGRSIPPGVGWHLTALLAVFKIFGKGGCCDCVKHAMVMDQWGPCMCLKRMDTILGWLEKEAKKRHLPFVRMIAKRLVLMAIRRAERDLGNECS